MTEEHVCNILKESDICTIGIEGVLSSKSARKFEVKISTLFRELYEENPDDPLPVLFNLSEITFLDSAGIAILVGVFMDARRRQLQIGFSDLNKMVEKTLQRTKVDSILRIFKSDLEGRSALIERERLYQRYKYNCVALLKNSESELKAQTVNISKGGVNATTKGNYFEREKIRLTIKELDLDLKVEILRVEDHGSDLVLAMEFIAIDSHDHKKLDVLIQKLYDEKSRKDPKNTLLILKPVK